MSQQLPTRPNLDHLKRQAKDVLRVFRRQEPQWKLADAQRAIARGYGFASWPSLKTHVEKIRHEPLPSTKPGARKPKPDDSFPSVASIHLFAGAWVADLAMSTPGDPRYRIEGNVLEFQVNAEELKLTQVATEATGRQVAITTSICADGNEQPFPFGEGFRLNARWTTSLTLEMTLTTSQGVTQSWKYQVSPDGRTLAVSTAKDRLVFRRL